MAVLRFHPETVLEIMPSARIVSKPAAFLHGPVIYAKPEKTGFH